MAGLTVHFEFKIGDKVIIPGLEKAVGRVVSLWSSINGEQYEVAYYCDGERKKDYFLSVELEYFEGESGAGFLSTPRPAPFHRISSDPDEEELPF